jgi:hypothetical protein
MGLVKYIMSFFAKDVKTHSAEGFPLKVIGHWYTGAWYGQVCATNVIGAGESMSGDKANTVSPAENEMAFNWRRCGISSSDTSNLIEGLVPAMKIGDTLGLYKVIKPAYLRSSLLSDPAGWDDCREIDLQFVKTVTLDD